MESQLKVLTLKDLTTQELPTWCPGCGDFNILFALKNALVDLKVPREDVVIVSGIGCGSKSPHFVKTYGFEGLHGRSLPVATGIKLANKDLKVIVVAGDGDTYGIGGNHFIHSMRRNLDITLIVQNNAVYGLTKGQYSPTSPAGRKTPSTPAGSIDAPINPLAVALTMGATFVARGFAYDSGLKGLIADAVKHKGFSLVDIFQPCPTYNKINTLAWYKEHLYKLPEGYDSGDWDAASRKVWEYGEKIPYGLFFRESRPTYEEQYAPSQKPVVKQDISNIDISKALKRFK